MVEIILAKSAGFCYGVKRAVNITTDALEKYNELYSGGNVVNNKDVVNELEEKGLKRYSDISELNHNANVLVRAHGIALNELKKYEELNCNIVDATCPNVKKIHNIVNQHANTDCKIIIIGDKGHPEIIGISSYAGNNFEIINSIDEVKKYDKVCIVAQTTFSKKLAKEIIEKIILASNEQIIYNTICEATSTRQNEVKKLADECEFVIVIGDKQSANSNRLYEIAKEINSNTIFIENCNEFEVKNLASYTKVGITAGASTPERVIEDVINKIKGDVKKLEQSF